MDQTDRVALVLAAGKGTRMHSDTPKVLKTILGEPMLWYVYQVLSELLGESILTVVGHGADKVRKAFPERESGFVEQVEQLGTGHALMSAWDSLKATGAACCLVVNGDTPLMPLGPLREFLDACEAQGTDLAFVTVTLQDAGSFGRVVRDEAGCVQAIVEAKDFDPAVHGEDRGEINAGVYFFRLAAIEPLLFKLNCENAAGEYYITDLIQLAVDAGLKVSAASLGDVPGLLGINSPLELVQAEERLRAAINTQWLQSNVIIRSPGSVRIGPRAAIAPGVEITGPCEILGATRIDRHACIGSGSYLRDARVEVGARVRESCHIEEAAIGPACSVGPFARLRPGAVLREGAHVGNFVEVKKSVLGKGSKAGHLTYLGDAEIGEGVNIGAGTITCNYDGKSKHKTVIGDRAFIGSNTALVAPISLGEDVLVGAGSTLTKDVEPGMLAIARARQSSVKRRK